LEFGYWTEDRALVQGAERFLVKVMRASEGVDPDADSFQPDLLRLSSTMLRWPKPWRCAGMRSTPTRSSLVPFDVGA
jgi:hypothetical protein